MNSGGAAIAPSRHFQLQTLVEGVQAAILKRSAGQDASLYVPGHGPVGSQADLKLVIEYVKHVLHSATSLVTGGMITRTAWRK